MTGSWVRKCRVPMWCRLAKPTPLVQQPVQKRHVTQVQTK
jgi:hypothetical protein